ncbi:replication initiation protein [Sphingomonas sp. LH128]|uniref:hypothetical protein n=1 Tax=Sphingomonas sp. LH128 TaxID=473781 RepID=UPI00027CAAB0|nr:hypothetical protein [Sphingomonas sp. LH128]EJU14013.1 replication initiation protein [Sphingomonas sp. LH128]
MTAAGSFSATPFGLLAAKVTKATLGRKTRALLERGDSPRSGEKVWRNSYYEGTIEHQVWKPIHDGTPRGGARWVGALMKAARAFEYKTRLKRRETEPGARNGELGEIGLEVLGFLYETVDYATGRLDPAIATIAEGIGRSYSAVHDALVRLRKANFLHWMRRSRPIEDPTPGGQQVEQISNAYALMIPPAMMDWVKSLFRKAPAPNCEQDRRKAEREAYEAMLAGLTAEERHDATWAGDRLLGETLKRLAAAVDARDFQKGESLRTGETGVSF